MMIPIVARARNFFRSLVGRIFLLLTVGMTVAAVLALLVAEQARHLDFERWRLQRVVASAVDIAQRLSHDPVRIEALLKDQQIMGARSEEHTSEIQSPMRIPY